MISELYIGRLRIIGFGLMLVVALTLPLLLSNFRVFQLTMVLIYGMALLGLNFLTGYTGQISLGHGAFFAMGAYTTAILMNHFAVPYWATVPVAGVLCFVFGFLFGRPALRLEGHYLALATFALAIAVPSILKHKSLEAWTGGVQGISLLKPAAPAWLPLSADRWLYFFTLAVAIVLFVTAHNLLRGRIGRAMIAIREHSVAAAVMGIDLPFYKSITFGISALYTGIAGALGAIALQFVAPDSFGVFLSVNFLVGAVVGGMTSILGTLFGAVFLVFVPNISEDISKAAPGAIFGTLLLLSLYVMPSGIAGLLAHLSKRFLSKR